VTRDGASSHPLISEGNRTHSSWLLPWSETLREGADGRDCHGRWAEPLSHKVFELVSPQERSWSAVGWGAEHSSCSLHTTRFFQVNGKEVVRDAFAPSPARR